MRFTLLVVALIAAFAGCTNMDATKSPCAGAGGSPCSRTPLSAEPMELSA